MAREVRVEIVGDSRSVEAAYARSAKAAKGFNQTVTGQFGGASLKRQALGFASGYLAIGSAAVAATAGIKSSIDAASNLNEQISRSDIVFGEASDAIEEWSKTTARSIGIARDEALEATGTFGGLFTTLGLGPKVAADMSIRLVQLAADMAALANTAPEEALIALRSGLVGEAEPLRRYNVRLSEARVQQEAMAASGKRNVKALTDQEKTLARYRIILTDTVQAQGNFKDTSEGFAQQVKILRASIRDLSGQLGNALLPVLTSVVTEMNDGITAGRGFAGIIRDVAEAARDAAEKIPGGEGGAGLFGRIAGEVREQATSRLGAGLLGGVPGVGQAKALYFAIGNVVYVVKQFHKEAAKPINFDFSAVNQLTKGLQSAGLAAKDLIELRGRGTFDPVVFTAEQRREFFDRRIARETERVQDIPTLRGQVQRLREISKLISDRIATTKDVTRKLNLEDELLRRQREIRSIQATIQANAEQAERDAITHQEEMARLARERAEKAREQRQAGLFAVLGFDPGGAERAPGIQALRRRFARVADALAGSPLAGKFKTQMASIRKVLNDEFTKTDKELRDKIEEMLAGIDRQLKDHTETRGRFRAFNVNRMLAGLGLSPDEIRKLRGRLSRIGPGGTVPGTGRGAFGMALAGAGGVTVHHQTIVDGRVVESSVTKRQQNRRRRNPSQKRGPYIGTLG